MTKRLTAIIYLLLATSIWGAAAPVIKFTLQGIDPFPFLSYRLFVSAIIGLVILFIIKPKIKNSDKLPVSIYGLLATTFALGFLFQGLDQTTVIEAGLIGAIGPLAVLAGGVIFLKEKIYRNEKIGVAIAFSGTILTIFSPALVGKDGIEIGGNILLLLFLLVDASSILMAKRLMKRVNPLAMTSIAFIIGAITIIPYTFFISETNFVREILEMPLKYHLGVWYMAVGSGTIAYFFFMKGVKLIEAGEAVLFSYLQPVFSIPLAVFWLGETVGPRHLVGAVIIATGVYIAEKRSS